jgi:hypothetical protein
MRKSFFRKIKFIIYRRRELKKNKILCPNSAPAHGPCLYCDALWPPVFRKSCGILELAQAQCPERVKEGI